MLPGFTARSSPISPDLSTLRRRRGKGTGSRSLIFRLIRQLGAVPNRNDPDCAILDAIEESIGRHNNLPISEVRKLRNNTT